MPFHRRSLRRLILYSIARKFWLIPVWALLLVFGVLAILAIVAGYIVFIIFVRLEGTRYFRVHTEIELAREIHRSLVPTVERKFNGFEIFGASVPSGEVGGDLVDLAESSGEWIAYIADISGHGVAAGALMAMFKTSLRRGRFSLQGTSLAGIWPFQLFPTRGHSR